MTPLERAARALAARHHQPQFDLGNSSLPGSQYADKYWRDYVGQARAVIEAIREPSEASVDRAMQAENVVAWGDCREFWRAHIDVLLEQPASTAAS